MSSRKAASATKKILYGLLGLVVVGSLAYSMSQGGNLLGFFSTGGGIEVEDSIKTNAEKASDAAENAKASRDEAESYANAAEAAVDDVASAYEDEDTTTLEAAQSSATEAAENTQNAANQAQSYADAAQSYYEAAYEVQNTAYEQVQAVSANVVSSFATYTAAQEAVDSAEKAVSDAETAIEDAENYMAACGEGDPSYSGSCYRTASENLEKAEATLEEAKAALESAQTNMASTEASYNAYVDEYADVYTKFSAKKDISDAAETYAETATTYATEAATFASNAAETEQMAYTYNFLSCQSLSISPNSYEMDASDTEASFDLTVSVTGQELIDTTDVDLNTRGGLYDNLLQLSPSWFQTFVISDFGEIGSEKWMGTLVFETDGSGAFSYESDEDSPLSVDADSENDVTVSFSGGLSGDTISIYADGEEEYCSEEFTITQASSAEDTDTSDETDTTTSTDTSDDDDDGDGLTVSEEEEVGTTDTDADYDDDGLTDGEEVLTYDTDPIEDDSDADGLTDGEEVETYNTNPSEEDSDADGLTDGEEILTYNTDPNDDDSDGDGVDDGDEIDDDTDPNDEDDVSEITVGDETETPTTTEEERVLALESSDYSCDDPFTDTRGEWYEEIVCRMYTAEVIEGESSTKFVPGDDVTRAEAIKMIVGLLLEQNERDARGLTSGFSDVNENDWYYDWLNLAEKADIIRTRDTGATFNPNTPITRGDLALYIARALDLSSYDYEITYDDMTGDEYFAYAIAILSEKTTDVPYDDSDEEVPVLEGYSSGYFKPYIYINRAEALTMIYRGYLAYLAD